MMKIKRKLQFRKQEEVSGQDYQGAEFRLLNYKEVPNKEHTILIIMRFPDLWPFSLDLRRLYLNGDDKSRRARP